VAILYAIRSTPRPRHQARRPLRIRVRPVMRGQLGRLLVGIGAFEVGNIAATLLILRATDLLQHGRGHDRAVELALLLYATYNLTATIASLPAGRVVDRRGAPLVLAAGVGCFLLAYVGFAATGASIAILAACFVAAGAGIGCVETAEHAAVAGLAPADLRGSAFGLLAAVQSFGNLVASAVAGVLWTAVSPAAGLLFAATLMAVALVCLAWARARARA
jgi:MFS family permease